MTWASRLTCLVSLALAHSGQRNAAVGDALWIRMDEVRSFETSPQARQSSRGTEFRPGSAWTIRLNHIDGWGRATDKCVSHDGSCFSTCVFAAAAAFIGPASHGSCTNRYAQITSTLRRLYDFCEGIQIESCWLQLARDNPRSVV